MTSLSAFDSSKSEELELLTSQLRSSEEERIRISEENQELRASVFNLESKVAAMQKEITRLELTNGTDLQSGAMPWYIWFF